MKRQRLILRASALVAALVTVSALFLFLITRGQMSVVLANSGGGPTYVTLTLHIEGEGNVNLDPPDETYSENTTESYIEDTEVQLMASCAADWKFIRWEGDLSGNTNPTSITMTSAKTVTAVFEQRKLTVTKDGEGEVSYDKPAPGDRERPTFTNNYAVDTDVTLTAHPDLWWAFQRWSGDHNSTSSPTTVTVDRDMTVKAEFEEIELKVHGHGDGRVEIDLPAPPEIRDLPFTQAYEVVTTVALTPKPNEDEGWAFVEWQDDLTGSSEPGSILVDGKKDVGVLFEKRQLTVSRVGLGDVTIAPPGVTPSEFPHTQPYAVDTSVILTADPASGWGFKEWTGAATGTDTTSPEILVNRDLSVEAVFEQIDLTISRQDPGLGHVRMRFPPSSETAIITSFPHVVHLALGTEVTLRAYPQAPEWGFKEWTGDYPSTDQQFSFTMDSAKSVEVVFGQFELTVTKTLGLGSVLVNPPNETPVLPFTQGYAAGTQIDLLAQPADGYVFLTWWGDITATTAAVTIDHITEDMDVEVRFEEIKLVVDRTGYGTVNINPPNFTPVPPFDTYPHTEYYDAVENVTLTATGDTVTTETGTTQWVFDYWNVNGSSEEITDNPLAVPVDGYRTVMAVFSARKLTVLKDGEGTVRVIPPTTTYTPPFNISYGNEDAQIILMAIANPGWGFKEWTGDFPGTNPLQQPSLSLLVDRDRTVTPVFEQNSLAINSVDASDPVSVKLKCSAAGTFDRVNCTTPTGTQTLFNVSGEFDITFSQNELPFGTYTFELKGFVNDELLASDSCTATRPNFAFTSYNTAYVWPYFLIEGVGATRIYTHGLAEEYYFITYSKSYDGKTGVVRKSYSSLYVDGDFEIVDYSDSHRFRNGTTGINNWQTMSPLQGGMGAADTIFKECIVTAEGVYVLPDGLNGIADITSIVMEVGGGNQSASVITGSDIERSIP